MSLSGMKLEFTRITDANDALVKEGLFLEIGEEGAKIVANSIARLNAYEKNLLSVYTAVEREMEECDKKIQELNYKNDGDEVVNAEDDQVYAWMKRYDCLAATKVWLDKIFKI